MKRALLIFLIIFIVMQFIQTKQENYETDKSLEIQAPKKVMNIFKNSCYDCHSGETSWPWYSNIAPFSWVINSHVKNGRKALDFSTWEKYTKEEKKEQLEDIYRTVYALMPLQSYVMFHKETDLTKEERKLIRDWTGVRD
ncbi:MAG: heme-binding domain-containing protein [Campylobacterota bacterium]